MSSDDHVLFVGIPCAVGRMDGRASELLPRQHVSEGIPLPLDCALPCSLCDACVHKEGADVVLSHPCVCISLTNPLARWWLLPFRLVVLSAKKMCDLFSGACVKLNGRFLFPVVLPPPASLHLS